MPFAQANGIRLFYRLDGSRDCPPVVFVSSLGTDHLVWSDVVALLRVNYFCVTYDKRGHGLSEVPDGDYPVDAHVADIIDLLDELGIPRAHVCGLSVGGLIARRLAATHPERLLGLVLCDTTPRTGTAAAWNERIERVRAGGMTAIADDVMARWFSPGFLADRPIEVAGWAALLRRTSPAGYIGTCATLRDTNLETASEAIAAPTLVLCGENDIATPPDLVRAGAQQIPGARFALVPGAAHLPPVEQPGLTAVLIERHLETIA